MVLVSTELDRGIEISAAADAGVTFGPVKLNKPVGLGNNGGKANFNIASTSRP